MVVGALWLVALYALTVLHLPSPNRLPSGRCRYYGTADRRLPPLV
jgi:hypothetical protein